jgi:prepilin peptidase CpaA
LLLLHAAWSDARTGLIPNLTTLPLLAIAPLAHVFMDGPGGLFTSIGSAIGCALVPLLLFRLGAMGGGDVKLFAAIGAIAGLHAGIEIQLLGYVVGAAFALVAAARNGTLGWIVRRALQLLLRPFSHAAARSEPAHHEAPREPAVQRLGLPVLIASLFVLAPRWLALGGWS